MLTGYYDDKMIPVLKGMKVRIPKGTTLRSLHPQKEGPYEAARTQTITVHHILPGQTYTLGTIYEKPDGSQKFFVNGIGWRELYHTCQDLGIDYPYGYVPEGKEMWLLEELKKTGQVTISERSPGNFDGRIFRVKLHRSNPSVNWAGSGRYWIEADINDVQIIGWFVDSEGELIDLTQLDNDTFLVEKTGSFISVHIGGYEAGEEGFRVDATYVLHLEKPSMAALSA